MEQFLRTEIILGKENLKKLKGSFVVLIGLGAVGGYALEALARAGVGRLRLVDFDKVRASNLNRNILSLRSTLDIPKVEAAKNRVKDINPACRVEAVEAFAAEESLPGLLDGKPDLVIDCIDAVNPKVQLFEFCVKNGIKMISSMGAALRTDHSAIKIGDISGTKGCPLAFNVRKKLRKKGVSKGVLCVYSDEPYDKNAVKGAEAARDENTFKRGRERRTLGSLPTLPGIFGLIAANEAIKILSRDAKDLRTCL
jgi:tRNA A37 threonylcarbamoyladenosine dehydratase